MPAYDADLVLLGAQTPLGFSVRSTVLDVRHKTGQAQEVSWSFVSSVALASIVSLAACSERGSPEHVADAFADAYFRQMDQEKAKEYTALGATAMLEKELQDVAQIRKEGYTAAEASSTVILRRGEAVQREQRLRFPYEVVIRSEGGETVSDADVELTRLGGEWKVVRVGLRARDATSRANDPARQ
jgi:hypothetical protein